jgi:hypothetical protein
MNELVAFITGFAVSYVVVNAVGDIIIWRINRERP